MTTPLHWFQQLTSNPGSNHATLAKVRWKILREGAHWRSFSDIESCTSSWKQIDQHGTAENGAIKWLLESVESSDRCEMVTLFPKGRRATVCVSSQIGCGVGCVFCATGSMGLKRNLSYLEIVEQVYLARQIALKAGRHLRNVVFMGMGEPLHNLLEVTKAIRWITSDFGFGISQRCVTVSTSGGNSGMVALAKQFPSVRLAVSLHSADQDLRRRLMPRAPNDLGALRATICELNSLQYGSLQTNAPVWLEVVLLEGLNDSEIHARQLIAFCDGLNVEVNLIPFNPIPSEERLQTTANHVHKRFANQLRSAGIITTIRQSLGGSDNAACGQLVVKNG